MPLLPPILQRQKKDELVLGRRGTNGLASKITISEDFRQLHCLVTGLTGTGKSFFISNLVVQDILAGRGVALVDPHSDLAKQVVARLIAAGYFDEESSHEQLMYVAPRRRDYIIPMNVLARPRPEAETYEITQWVINSFVRADPEALRVAPRFKQIMRSALAVLIETGESLVSLHRLLTDDTFRSSELAQIADPNIATDSQRFFEDEFERWGRERHQMLNPVTNKSSALTDNPSLYYMLALRENRLNLRRIMDEGIVLLVDLSGCDQETRKLFPNLIVSGFEYAALSRSDTRPEERRRYYLVVDEWQSLVAHEGQAETFSEMLSQVRKYGLSLILANQSVAQLSRGLQIALDNAQTFIAFRVSRADAKVLTEKLAWIDTQRVKNEPLHESQYPLYEPLSNQLEDLYQQLTEHQRRQATVKLADGSQSVMWTEKVKPHKLSHEQIEAVIKTNLQVHGKPFEEVRVELIQRPDSSMPLPGGDMFDE